MLPCLETRKNWLKKKKKKFHILFFATMKSQVANDKGLSHPDCLIDTGATAHSHQAPSHCFLNSFWDRADNSSPQNISFCDISGTDVAKESCQHCTELSDSGGWSPPAPDLALMSSSECKMQSQLSSSRCLTPWSDTEGGIKSSSHVTVNKTQMKTVWKIANLFFFAWSERSTMQVSFI